VFVLMCVCLSLWPALTRAQSTLVLLTLMVASLFLCIGGIHVYLKWKENRSVGHQPFS